MTIIQDVRDALVRYAGKSMTTQDIVDALGNRVNREQVNSALWRLRAEDDMVKQVRTGLHKYLGPTEDPKVEMPKLEKTLAEALDVFEDEPRVDEHMYFTQVGVAENGDLILSRDSDTRVYRATPV